MNTTILNDAPDTENAQSGYIQANSRLVKVWDPLVRIFHWSLVSAFFIAYFTEDDFLTLHVYAGYLIGGLLVFRLVWGFIGSRHARFSDFVKPPREVWAYIKSIFTTHPKRYLGHNPAGGAMVIALLLSLVMVTVTGVALYGIEESAGPLATSLSGAGEFWEDVTEEMHEFFSNATLALVFFHVLGVIMASLQHRENLAKAMVDGRKSADEEGDA